MCSHRNSCFKKKSANPKHKKNNTSTYLNTCGFRDVSFETHRCQECLSFVEVSESATFGPKVRFPEDTEIFCKLRGSLEEQGVKTVAPQ